MEYRRYGWRMKTNGYRFVITDHCVFSNYVSASHNNMVFIEIIISHFLCLVIFLFSLLNISDYAVCSAITMVYGYGAFEYSIFSDYYPN